MVRRKLLGEFKYPNPAKELARGASELDPSPDGLRHATSKEPNGLRRNTAKFAPYLQDPNVDLAVETSSQHVVTTGQCR